MNRWPLVASFILFIVLCASAAYWAMQLFKPPVRPVAAPPRAAKAEVRPEAAAALFGGTGSKAAVASNYQLKGVVMSGTARDSVAILSADGKPAQAVRVDMEVMPGVIVKEVHREYVLLSEGGVTKRVELPDSAKDETSPASISPVPVRPAPMQRVPPPRTAAPAAPPAAVVSPTPRVVPPGTPPQPQAAVPPGAVPPGATLPGAMPPGAVPPGTVRPAPANPATGTPSPAPAVTLPGSGPATQMINPPQNPPPPNPESPMAYPPSPEPVPGAMPGQRAMPGQ